MKLVALFLLVLLSYVAFGSGAVAAEEPETNQGEWGNRYIQPFGSDFGYVDIPARKEKPKNDGLRQLMLIFVTFLISIMQKPVTTAEPTTAAKTTAVMDSSTTLAGPTTTADPYADWIPGKKNCVFKLFKTSVTATKAKEECEDKKSQLASAIFNDAEDSDAREKIIKDAGATSVTFWVGAASEADGNADGDADRTKWFVPSSATPVDKGIKVPVADDAFTTGELCGRFAAADPDKIIFDKCAGESYPYLCEFCGAI